MNQLRNFLLGKVHHAQACVGGRRVLRVARQPRLPTNAMLVRRDNTPLHIKRGWKRRGKSYTGYFKTTHGAWPGRIDWCGDKFRVYITSPPMDVIMSHSRWVCFHPLDGERYEIDLAQSPPRDDVDSVIHYVENLITEGYRLAALERGSR